MPWNDVIKDIITQPQLTTALNSYVTKAAHTSDLATKLNHTGGTATNLTLSGVPTADWHPAHKKYVDDAITTVSTNIGNLAPKASPTFTGTVTIPAGGSANTAVNLSQLQLYLPLTGGTVSGTIAASTAPSLGTHLTNKTYVDNLVSPKAATTYVDSSIATVNTNLSTNDIAKTGGTYTGIVNVPSPPNTDNGTRVATTSFVHSLTGIALRDIDGSVDAKLELMASRYGAELMNAKVLDEQDVEDKSNLVATHEFVHKAIEHYVYDLVLEAVSNAVTEALSESDN